MDGVHDEAFFEQMRQQREPYRRLAECIHETLGVQKALDIGCGIGLQTKRLKELGWSIDGADSAPAAVEMRELGVDVLILDLTVPITTGKYADTVICTETAEHIPAEHADMIVQNVSGLARDYIVWSAAVPGQEWSGHVNLQPPSYWLERFAARGWVPSEIMTARLRDLMWRRQAQHTLAKDNFFVLVPKREQPRAGKLDHFYQTIPGYFSFEDFYTWLAKEFPYGHGVEVGSYAGRSAAFLATELHNRYVFEHAGGPLPCLDLVDTFTAGGSISDVRRTLEPVEHIIGALHACQSHEGAAHYADASLDFVYIDADHSYAAVRRDIDAWLPKVKPGGIIAGHDFRNGHGFGVIEAVLETFDRVDVWKGSRFDGDGVRVFEDRTGLGEFYPTWCARVGERKVTPSKVAPIAAPRPLHMTITSTALNAEKWAVRCIESVQKQSFARWTHVFVDAGSTDGTWLAACAQADSEPQRTKVERRTVLQTALQNAYDVWVTLPDDEVIVWLDGDDWLAHDRALEVLASVYEGPDEPWLTYGQFMFPDGRVGFASPHVNPNFRADAWRATHLKTFRAGLVKKIKPADLLKPDGTWCDLAIDHVVMYPLLEMAGRKHAFIDRILCVYNYEASWWANRGEAEREKERAEDQRLRAMPRYPALTARPW